MEELINQVASKSGISEAQARDAVNTVLGFLKDTLPEPIAGQLDNVVAGGGGVAGSLGDIAGEDGDHAGAFLMRRDHDVVGLVLGHVELTLQHHDDELTRRVVVVEQDDLVQPRPLDLRLDLGTRGDDRIAHRRKCSGFMRNARPLRPESHLSLTIGPA